MTAAARLAAVESAIIRLEGLRAALDHGRTDRVDARVDLLQKILATHVRSARAATRQFHERLGEIATLRARDVASTKAALAEVKHEAEELSRVTRVIQNGLEELASGIEDLRRRLEVQARAKQERKKR